jgi:hypothetical protein
MFFKSTKRKFSVQNLAAGQMRLEKIKTFADARITCSSSIIDL